MLKQNLCLLLAAFLLSLQQCLFCLVFEWNFDFHMNLSDGVSHSAARLWSRHNHESKILTYFDNFSLVVVTVKDFYTI